MNGAAQSRHAVETQETPQAQNRTRLRRRQPRHEQPSFRSRFDSRGSGGGAGAWSRERFCD
jgi:hypothetical protein